MKPDEPISPKKLGWMHKLFAEIGEEATEAVRDEIEKLTGERSTKSLTEAQAWEFLHGLFAHLGRKNGFPMKRFAIKDGEIRRAEQVGKVVTALRNMKNRSAREGGRRMVGNHEHGARRP